MAKIVQRRRGTTAEHATFTGALGELTVDSTKDTVVVHDGAVAGGYPLLRQDLSNLPAGTIDNADINASAGIVDTKLATIATAGKVSNSATTATDANTASAIVARDGSGNFTAGTITAALTGAASSNVLKAGDTMTGALAVPLASASTPSLTFTGDTNTGIYSPGADTLAVSTAGSERLRITSAGLVGIGTSSPAALFHTAGAGLFRAALVGTEATLPAESASLSLLNGAYYGTTPSVSFNIGSHNWDAVNNNNAFRWSITTPSPSAGAGLRLDINSRSFDGTSTYTTTPRVTIDGTGRVGIGTTSPGATLNLYDATAPSFRLGQASVTYNSYVDSSNYVCGTITNHPFVFTTNNTERARIDSSGRLLVGTSSAVAGGDASAASLQIVSNITSAISGALLTLARGQSAGSINSSDLLGGVEFSDTAGNTYSRIQCQADAATAVGDCPGRLVFSTTADGASSPTERLRINSAGVLQIADAGNITVGTTTGTKIGTATTQKLGFYNATPVVQPAAVADATDAASVITQLNDLLAKLRTLGIIAT